MRTLTSAIALCAIALSGASAQSLAARVAASDGEVQVIYPSRESACGDGRNFIGNLFGRSTYYSGTSTFSGRGSWTDRPCVHGPARVTTTVVDGEPSRLRAYVGPIPTNSGVRTINATAAEAAAWLGDLITKGSARMASDAMLPLALAAGNEPWPVLLRVARDDDRPTQARRAALTWLAMGVNDKLGLTDEPETDDDEMRKQAVFVLSQRPKNESVPELLELARNARRPVARREAIFWLGQTGDRRAADLYADLLNLR